MAAMTLQALDSVNVRKKHNAFFCCCSNRMFCNVKTSYKTQLTQFCQIYGRTYTQLKVALTHN